MIAVGHFVVFSCCNPPRRKRVFIVRPRVRARLHFVIGQATQMQAVEQRIAEVGTDHDQFLPPVPPGLLGRALDGYGDSKL